MHSFTGLELFTKMQNSFGWATAGHGYKNKTFPAAVGETGSFFSTARALSDKLHSASNGITMSITCKKYQFACHVIMILNLGLSDVQAADVAMLTDMARYVHPHAV